MRHYRAKLLLNKEQINTMKEVILYFMDRNDVSEEVQHKVFNLFLALKIAEIQLKDMEARHEANKKAL